MNKRTGKNDFYVLGAVYVCYMRTWVVAGIFKKK